MIGEYKIVPENMYNRDESGFSIGEIQPGKCIINAQIRQQFQTKPGRQEWVTSVECICADGTALPPLIIFKAENLSREWIPANTHNDWCFSCNSKGWTSNQHGIEWLRRVFDPSTREKANGSYRLLICDGHDSHITGEWIGYCMDNSILVMILPPHSSHLTQPLDVGIFSPLKKYVTAKIEPLIRTGISRVQTVEWTAAFVAAHQEVFTIQNIKGGFRGTGIHPFLPTKVLNRVSRSETPGPKTPSPPRPITTPFTDAVLTSSPLDISAVRVANAALNQLIQSGEPLPTPAKQYVSCVTRTSERLYASKIILEKEKEELQTVVMARKQRLSGKRKAIGDESLITTVRILNEVREAEIATRKRDGKRRKKSGKRGCRGILNPTSYFGSGG